jgi:hypothetical protein
MRAISLSWALLLAACSGEPPPTGNGPGGLEDNAVEVDDALAGPVREARADVERQSGVEPGEVRLISAEFVTWPNSALGCPEAGMAYMQALTPGYRIRFETPNRVFHYHGARGKSPFHCPGERVAAPAKTELPEDPRV